EVQGSSSATYYRFVVDLARGACGGPVCTIGAASSSSHCLHGCDDDTRLEVFDLSGCDAELCVPGRKTPPADWMALLFVASDSSWVGARLGSAAGSPSTVERCFASEWPEDRCVPFDQAPPGVTALHFLGRDVLAAAADDDDD